MSLGKCVICGQDAGVIYPLLPGSPAFCGQHHNPQAAGRFGCDFTGPDDFDIPDDLDGLVARTALTGKSRARFGGFTRLGKPISLTRRSFVWTDICGFEHKLKDIDDNYLRNIIRYLERGRGHVGEAIGRDNLIKFLKDEAYRRISRC